MHRSNGLKGSASLARWREAASDWVTLDEFIAKLNPTSSKKVPEGLAIYVHLGEFIKREHNGITQYRVRLTDEVKKLDGQTRGKYWV